MGVIFIARLVLLFMIAEKFQKAQLAQPQRES
jgi:hypothetical protein